MGAKRPAAKPAAAKRAATGPGAAPMPPAIAAYHAAAPVAGQPLLHRLHAILAEAAPDAQQVIKWNVPFFVEPRFLFSYSAHKAHASFAPMSAAMRHFRDELAGRRTTKNFLQLPYGEPLPEELIRRIAAWCVDAVAARTDDGFWGPP